MLPSEPRSGGPEAVQLRRHPKSSERSSAALAELLGRRGQPNGVVDGVKLGGVRFQTREVVEEAQSRGVERTGSGSDHWNEPEVFGLKPLVVLRHLDNEGSL